jgi:hypothetical protein
LEPTVAFIADGALFRVAPGQPAQRVESTFALEVRGRAQEIHRRHAWKSEGRGAMFMSRGLMWGGAGRDGQPLLVRMTDVARGTSAGELLYAMNAEGRTAVCRWRAEDGLEQRLLHGSERHLADLAVAPTGAEVACSVAHPDGSASLAVMSRDATDILEVTEGEVRDSAPSWAPGTGRRLVYASAGVGRDAQGRFAGLGPSALHAIDLERGEVEELASDPKRDLLQPRIAADGTLYYIARPHASSERPGGLRLALDLLLLPLRLLYAVFQYLSFFTARYTGRPLTTAGGPKRTGADVRRMQMWSNLIEAEENADEAEPRPAIPASWKLMRRRTDGRSEVVAESVLAYDVDAEGRVVYTSGSAIQLVEPDGTRRRVLVQGGIQQVAFAG